ncbi:MAG: hypothetical protein NC393_03415 [Clostridium sp.]|nr:hypothetical protein [Clostridium sp.]MCM1208497.1 hypothetical protein [Ruminococcus sp.]
MKRLMKSFSRASLILLFIGIILLVSLIRSNTFPQLFMPAHDYDEVLEDGLKKGQHIKGDIYYSFGSFASQESYTQYENSRTASKTTGYYYLIPVGEQGVAAIYVRKDDLSAMKTLTAETEAYLMGGEFPKTTVHFEGTAVKMEKQLDGLEDAFRDGLKEMGYTDSEIEEMISAYSDGECLVLYGPADVSVMYVMTAISFVLILLAIVLVVVRYRKEARLDKMEAGQFTQTTDGVE